MTKKDVANELKKLGVAVPETANIKDLKELLVKSQPKKEPEKPKAEKGKVIIYDVNEKAMQVSKETAEDLLKLGGYRKELPKK